MPALPGTLDAPTINAIVPGGRLLLLCARDNNGELRPQQLLLGLFAEQRASAGPVRVRAQEYATECGKNGRSLRLQAPRDPASSHCASR